MPLTTSLEHMNSAQEVNDLISAKENVMICCGRMGPMCIPVYDIMDELKSEYPNVEFRDMDFDHPEAAVIRNLDECATFRGLPFTIYYKNGKIVKATSSLQDQEQITTILDEFLK